MSDIDKKIGLIIRTVRKSKGLSQIELAGKMDLSFQQIQKYEKGATRLSVFRLRQIAAALDIPLTSFFEEKDQGLKVSGPTVKYGAEEEPTGFYQHLGKEEIMVLKLFLRLKNKKITDGFLKQLRGMVELEKMK